MIPTIPSIGIQFSIAKLYDEPRAYGTESWLIFFESVPLARIAGTQLFHGDTDDMYTFIIAFQSIDGRMISEIQSLVSNHPRFGQFCADPPFVSGPALFREPLTWAGRVRAAGVLEAPDNCVKEAWEIFSKRKE